MDAHTIVPTRPERPVRIRGSRVYHADLRLLKAIDKGAILTREHRVAQAALYKLTGVVEDNVLFNFFGEEMIQRLVGRGLLEASAVPVGARLTQYRLTDKGRGAIANKGILQQAVELPDLFLSPAP